jgi:hypothetical protein
MEVFTLHTKQGPVEVHHDNAWYIIDMYYKDTWDCVVKWSDYSPPPMRVGETIEINYEELPIRKDDIVLQYVIRMEDQGFSRHVYARWLGQDEIFTPDQYDKLSHPCPDLWEK